MHSQVKFFSIPFDMTLMQKKQVKGKQTGFVKGNLGSIWNNKMLFCENLFLKYGTVYRREIKYQILTTEISAVLINNFF